MTYCQSQWCDSPRESVREIHLPAGKDHYLVVYRCREHAEKCHGAEGLKAYDEGKNR